jgi:hypothetical protein
LPEASGREGWTSIEEIGVSADLTGDIGNLQRNLTIESKTMGESVSRWLPRRSAICAKATLQLAA